jgi:hypothetical protein
MTNDDKRQYRQLIMMKEIRSNYKSKMKDKKHFISQSEYIYNFNSVNSSNRMLHNVAWFYENM